MFKGQVYKFTGNTGSIRPKEFGKSRQDVLFKNTEKKFKIGDKVLFTYELQNGRCWAVVLEHDT
jgi:hypothetical protein